MAQAATSVCHTVDVITTLCFIFSSVFLGNTRKRFSGESIRFAENYTDPASQTLKHFHLSTMTASKRRILVTGGCGYIGSHTLVSLLDPSNAVEYSVVVIDNLANSSAESLRRVADISGLSNFVISADGNSATDSTKRLVFRKVDCCDKEALRTVFAEFASCGGFDAAVHFAGLKAVGESKLLPLSYYSDNIGSTLTLLSLMEEYGCRSIVFSSSATVYGIAKDESAKLKEEDEVGVTITNCYGRTKYMIEQILGDFHSSHKFLRDSGKSDAKDWSVTILRYFNPVGAHPSGNMGEDVRILMPSQVQTIMSEFSYYFLSLT